MPSALSPFSLAGNLGPSLAGSSIYHWVTFGGYLTAWFPLLRKLEVATDSGNHPHSTNVVPGCGNPLGLVHRALTIPFNDRRPEIWRHAVDPPLRCSVVRPLEFRRRAPVPGDASRRVCASHRRQLLCNVHSRLSSSCKNSPPRHSHSPFTYLHGTPPAVAALIPAW